LPTALKQFCEPMTLRMEAPKLPLGRVLYDTDRFPQIRHLGSNVTGAFILGEERRKGFSVGGQVEQTDLEIEQIARAFFIARHESAVWESAPGALKHDFRLYAKQAIRMLERRQEQVDRNERETLSSMVPENAWPTSARGANMTKPAETTGHGLI
jgi:hypothetical protein